MDCQDYVFDSESEGSDPDIELENHYYQAKSLQEEGDAEGALAAFSETCATQARKGEWGFKALAHTVKLLFALGRHEEILDAQYKGGLAFFNEYNTNDIRV